MGPSGEPDRVARAAAWLLSHPRRGAAAALLLTALLGASATRIRPDFSLEQLFPLWDAARAEYDRYHRQFPGEDARAIVVVAGTGLLEPDGLRAIGRLEEALAAIPGVSRVLGPASVDHLAMGPFGPARERLLDPGLAPEEVRRRVEDARADPLLGLIFPAGGGAVALLVDLSPAAAGSDAGRAAFTRAAEERLAALAPAGWGVTLSGLPPIRARLAGLVSADVTLLVPLAVVLVLVLLAAAFRSLTAVVAGLATLSAALTWSYGLLGAIGWPLGMLMGIMPILVVIVSVGDTVHLLAERARHLRDGLGDREAVVRALAASALPCLLTEAVLAAGFLTLVAIPIAAAIQLGVVAAGAMLLTWLANVLVLPLVLAALPPSTRGPHPVPAFVRAAERAVAWIGEQALGRPRRVLAVALVVVLLAAAAASRVRVLYFVFDDVRPGSRVEREIRTAEALLGGLVPAAIHVEVEGNDGAALDPEAVRAADRAARFLRAFPEAGGAASLADFVAPLQRALAGEVAGEEGLPDSREGMAQLLATLGDARLVADVLSADRRSLAAVARFRDVGSARVDGIFREVDRFLSAEQAALDARPEGPRIRLSATGQLKLFQDVNARLLGGLAASFGGALLLSVLLMSVALRSWRLGLIGLVPNASPVLLVLAIMALTGIPLTPVTVTAFSITLVIADDDTIQFLARFRRNLARLAAGRSDGEAHREAARLTLREAGVPMLLSGAAVSLGFSVLLLSEFLSPARLGALIGATLFASVFADLFLTPLLLARFLPLARRPR